MLLRELPEALNGGILFQRGDWTPGAVGVTILMDGLPLSTQLATAQGQFKLDCLMDSVTLVATHDIQFIPSDGRPAFRADADVVRRLLLAGVMRTLEQHAETRFPRIWYFSPTFEDDVYLVLLSLLGMVTATSPVLYGTWCYPIEPKNPHGITKRTVHFQFVE